VVGSLINPQLKSTYVQSVQGEYEKLRSTHSAQQARPVLSLEEARARRTPIAWRSEDIPQPSFLGIRSLSSNHASNDPSSVTRDSSFLPLSALVPFIDWSPFFYLGNPR
jgi:5-methyltetrahydrofolate--homocysteine methyltransferase